MVNPFCAILAKLQENKGPYNNDMSRFRILVAATLALSSLSAFAQSVVGTWKGKTEIRGVNVPEGTTKGMSNMKNIMVFSKDGTFKQTVSDARGKEGTSEGTWTQKGNSITLTTKKRDGKAATGNTSHVLTLSSDGKKLTRDLTAQVKVQAGGKAPEGMDMSKVKVQIVYTRSS